MFNASFCSSPLYGSLVRRTGVVFHTTNEETTAEEATAEEATAEEATTEEATAEETTAEETTAREATAEELLLKTSMNFICHLNCKRKYMSI